MSLPKVILNSGKEKSIQRRHPWIFSGAVYGVSREINDGEMVDVVDSKNNHLGTGYFSDKGSIVVRILTFADETFSDNFWAAKLQSAWYLRTQLLDFEVTNAFRVIHGEGDGISGLIIDYYDKNWVIQAHSTGVFLQMEQIAEAIKSNFPEYCETIYCKSSGTLPNTGTDYFLFGNKAEAVAKENNILFSVNWVEGQKTGFFLDQRENRKLLGEFSKGKKVLNTFCYTGGFSIYAMSAGAELVTSVDISQKAVDLAASNMELNFPNANHKAVADDVFNFMKENHQIYDVIVLDPPSFARNKKKTFSVAKDYSKLTTEAVELINPKGILIASTNAANVNYDKFKDMVQKGIDGAKRSGKLLETYRLPEDFHVSENFSEGNYLKVLMYEID